MTKQLIVSLSWIRSAALMVGVLAAGSDASAESVSLALYCSQLRELNNYAMNRARFAPILGPLREGNYHEAKLSLTGWSNCAFYGTSTYTCDSEFKSQDQAEQAQPRIAREILDCFAGTWQEASEQIGPNFIVLHPKLGPASITLNLDQSDQGAHLVRLILFLRR